MSHRFLRNTTIVGLLTLLSRVTGVIRDMVYLISFGAGPLMDAFLVAFKIPNFLRRLFAEGAFNMAFVPMFSKKLEGGEDAQGFARVAIVGRRPDRIGRRVGQEAGVVSKTANHDPGHRTRRAVIDRTGLNARGAVGNFGEPDFRQRFNAALIGCRFDALPACPARGCCRTRAAAMSGSAMTPSCSRRSTCWCPRPLSR